MLEDWMRKLALAKPSKKFLKFGLPDSLPRKSIRKVCETFTECVDRGRDSAHSAAHRDRRGGVHARDRGGHCGVEVRRGSAVEGERDLRGVRPAKRNADSAERRRDEGLRLRCI